MLSGRERSEMLLTLLYTFLHRKAKIAFLALMLYAALC